MKAAHQALILDGEGSLSVQDNAPTIVLSNDYIQKLTRCETFAGFPEEDSSSGGREKTLDISSTEGDEELRQRGDVALLREVEPLGRVHCRARRVRNHHVNH